MSDLQVLRVHDGHRFCTALVKVGNKHMHAVVMDDCGIRVISGPKEDLRYSQPLERKGAPYPIDRLVRKFRAFGRERGITEAAKAILNEVVS
jgi:hypothetical protein